MSPNESYLKDYLCSNCHVAILQTHPEEKFRLLNYFKCPLCGFTKEIGNKKSPFDRIINDRDK